MTIEAPDVIEKNPRGTPTFAEAPSKPVHASIAPTTANQPTETFTGGILKTHRIVTPDKPSEPPAFIPKPPPMPSGSVVGWNGEKATAASSFVAPEMSGPKAPDFIPKPQNQYTNPLRPDIDRLADNYVPPMTPRQQVVSPDMMETNPYAKQFADQMRNISRPRHPDARIKPGEADQYTQVESMVKAWTAQANRPDTPPEVRRQMLEAVKPYSSQAATDVPRAEEVPDTPESHQAIGSAAINAINRAMKTRGIAARMERDRGETDAGYFNEVAKQRAEGDKRLESLLRESGLRRDPETGQIVAGPNYLQTPIASKLKLLNEAIAQQTYHYQRLRDDTPEGQATKAQIARGMAEDMGTLKAFGISFRESIRQSVGADQWQQFMGYAPPGTAANNQAMVGGIQQAHPVASAVGGAVGTIPRMTVETAAIGRSLAPLKLNRFGPIVEHAVQGGTFGAIDYGINAGIQGHFDPAEFTKSTVAMTVLPIVSSGLAKMGKSMAPLAVQHVIEDQVARLPDYLHAASRAGIDLTAEAVHQGLSLATLKYIEDMAEGKQSSFDDLAHSFATGASFVFGQPQTVARAETPYPIREVQRVSAENAARRQQVANWIKQATANMTPERMAEARELAQQTELAARGAETAGGRTAPQPAPAQPEDAARVRAMQESEIAQRNKESSAAAEPPQFIPKPQAAAEPQKVADQSPPRDDSRQTRKSAVEPSRNPPPTEAPALADTPSEATPPVNPPTTSLPQKPADAKGIPESVPVVEKNDKKSSSSPNYTTNESFDAMDAIAERPQAKRRESALRKEFGDETINSLRQSGFVTGTAGADGPLSLTVKGREQFGPRPADWPIITKRGQDYVVGFVDITGKTFKPEYATGKEEASKGKYFVRVEVPIHKWNRYADSNSVYRSVRDAVSSPKAETPASEPVKEMRHHATFSDREAADAEAKRTGGSVVGGINGGFMVIAPPKEAAKVESTTTPPVAQETPVKAPEVAQKPVETAKAEPDAQKTATPTPVETPAAKPAQYKLGNRVFWGNNRGMVMFDHQGADTVKVRKELHGGGVVMVDVPRDQLAPHTVEGMGLNVGDYVKYPGMESDGPYQINAINPDGSMDLFARSQRTMRGVKAEHVFKTETPEWAIKPTQETTNAIPKQGADESGVRNEGVRGSDQPARVGEGDAEHREAPGKGAEEVVGGEKPSDGKGGAERPDEEAQSGKVKQPWEMTLGEYRRNQYPASMDGDKPVIDISGLSTEERRIAEKSPSGFAYASGKKTLVEFPAGWSIERARQSVDDALVDSRSADMSVDQHRAAVEQALREGKAVPPEVLADYPDLAAKYGNGGTAASRSELETKRQMYVDAIGVKRSNGETIPNEWIEGLAEVEDQLKGRVAEKGIASLQVFGHPEVTSDQKYSNLIPIRVSDRDSVERRITKTQALIDELQAEVGTTESVSKGRIKATPQERKLATEKMRSHNYQEKMLVLEQLRKETMPELNRLLRELPAKGESANVQPDRKADDAVTPPASEKGGTKESAKAENATVERTTPRKGTPEREAFDAENRAAFDADDKLRESYEKLKDERDRTRAGTKKRDNLEKQMDRAVERIRAAKEDHDARRESAHTAHLEDIMESGDEANRLAAQMKLRDKNFQRGDHEKNNADYRRMQELAAEEAKRQGADSEDVNSIALGATSMLAGYPGIRSLADQVGIEIRSLNASKNVAYGKDRLASMNDLDADSRRDYGNRIESEKNDRTKIDGILEEASKENDRNRDIKERVEASHKRKVDAGVAAVENAAKGSKRGLTQANVKKVLEDAEIPATAWSDVMKAAKAGGTLELRGDGNNRRMHYVGGTDKSSPPDSNRAGDAKFGPGAAAESEVGPKPGRSTPAPEDAPKAVAATFAPEATAAREAEAQQKILAGNKDTITKLREFGMSAVDSARRYAGKTFPTLTRYSPESGEAGATLIASKEMAKYQGEALGHKVLDAAGIDAKDESTRRKLGAVLSEDNLRGVRQKFTDRAAEARAKIDAIENATDRVDELLKAREEIKDEDSTEAKALRKEINREIGYYKRIEVDQIFADSERAKHDATATDAEEQAKNVRTLVGAEESPFKTEDEYRALLRDPKINAAITAHRQFVNPRTEENYRLSKQIDPDVELPRRGADTNTHMSLKAILDEPDVSQTKLPAGGNLRNTLRKHSPFEREAFGTAEKYETDYLKLVEHSFQKGTLPANQARFYKSLVDSGLAVIGEPGETPTLDGKKTMSLPLEIKSLLTEGGIVPQNKRLYVREDVYREVRNALSIDRQEPGPTFRFISNLHTQTALLSGVEAISHAANHFAVMFKAPLMKGEHLPDWVVNAPVGRIAGILDAVGTKAVKMLMGDQAVREELAKLAEIGALKPHSEHRGSKWNPTTYMSKTIEHLAAASRLVLNDGFDRIVRADVGVEDTPTARRDYVNQVGQYHKEAQASLVRAVRDYLIGSFATAGSTFHSQALRTATLDPGVKAEGLKNQAMLRALSASQFVGTLAMVALVNYMRSGQLQPKGTPWGSLYLGDDEQGRPRSIDVADIIGLKRAARATGAEGFIQGMMDNATPSQMLDSSVQKAASAAISPYMGPMPTAAIIAMRGYSPHGFNDVTGRVAPGESQSVANVKSALLHANPSVGTTADKTSRGERASDILLGQFGKFAPRTGKAPENVPASQAESFLREVARTKASSVTPRGDEREKKKTMGELLVGVKRNAETGKAAVDRAVLDGKINADEAERIIKQGGMDPVAWHLQRVGAKDSAKAYGYMTPDQRETYGAKVADRIASSSLKPNEQDALYKQSGITPPQDLAIQRLHKALQDMAHPDTNAAAETKRLRDILNSGDLERGSKAYNKVNDEYMALQGRSRGMSSEDKLMHDRISAYMNAKANIDKQAELLIRQGTMSREDATKWAQDRKDQKYKDFTSGNAPDLRRLSARLLPAGHPS